MTRPVAPADLVRYPPANDFGHRPEWLNEHCCGCDRCGGRVEREVCARCFETEWVIGPVLELDPALPDGYRVVVGRYPKRHPVTWPCTSAIVLGLIDIDTEEDS